MRKVRNGTRKWSRELATIGAFEFFLLCRHVHPEAGILYLPIHADADRINRPVCKNAVTQAQYGSCTLLVKGSRPGLSY